MEPSLREFGHKGPAEPLNKPEGWWDLPQEYTQTSEDEQSGLSEVLEQVRDSGAQALEEMFKQAGLDKAFYQRIEKIPVGLNRGKDANISGKIEPGAYGIILGYDSDEIQDWLESPEEPTKRRRGQLLQDVSHEMVHTVLVGKDDEGSPRSISNLMQTSSEYRDRVNLDAWTALEEGITETVAMSALKMARNGTTLTEEAGNLESYIAENDAFGMPLTMVCARLIRKMTPEQRYWYLTAAQTGEYKNDRLAEAFGEDYENFLNDLPILELGEDNQLRTEEQFDKMVNSLYEAIDLIDEHLGADEYLDEAFFGEEAFAA